MERLDTIQVVILLEKFLLFDEELILEIILLAITQKNINKKFPKSPCTRITSWAQYSYLLQMKSKKNKIMSLFKKVKNTA